MTVADNLKDHSVEVIEEYLTAARACSHRRKDDGGMLGYSAALLLLCATDAIGRAFLPPRKDHAARLDVLKEPAFGLSLTDPQIGLLRLVYRNVLAHSGQLGRDAFLSPEADGKPFEFSGDRLTMMRVPVLYRVVKSGWDKSKRDFHPKDADKRPSADPPAQKPDPFAHIPNLSSGRR